MTTVFAYGTLRCPAVREALLQRHARAQEDVFVRGFQIHPVLDCLYPGAICASSPTEIDSTVPGTLIFDLSAEEMALLDLFEDEYVKHHVEVQSSLDASITPAIIYVWNQPMSCLNTDRVWSFKSDYEAQGELRNRFIQNAVEFRSRSLDPHK